MIDKNQSSKCEDCSQKRACDILIEFCRKKHKINRIEDFKFSKEMES